jgi:predicted nuclease of predicted toxin-antitoxin system
VTRLLIDENVPLASTRLLRERGHDVISVQEERQGASDTEIAQWSAHTRRIIVTFDRDFGDSIYLGRMDIPAGVLFLRFVPSDELETGEIVDRLFVKLNDNVFGQMTSFDRRHARQRPLPAIDPTHKDNM